MSKVTQEQTAVGGCPPFPQSIMTASRDELDNLSLEIEGELPEDLQGHVFIVAPVGTIDSGGLPFQNGNTWLNGDGMIYRLDFNCQGEVRLTTRIAKPLDYYVDWLTKKSLLKFKNHGIIRFSFLLGARNELNTAFQPMKFPGEESDRLLITYDGGRPYEIDPVTLKLITPIGKRKEWRPEFKIPKYPFNPILSTAHPGFDPYNSQLFTVNYGRSLANFIETLPQIDDLPQKFKDFLEKLSGLEDFVYLVRWDGTNPLERWKLVNSDGSSIVIKQSIHQIGVTEDYVVLMDTSFTMGLEQVLNNPDPDNQPLERKLRKLLEEAPSPNSVLYIVRREDLKQKPGQHPDSEESEVEIVAYRVSIPLEASHFLVDYENPNQKITLHVGHICAWDVAEWLRSYDESVYPHSSIPSRLYGTQQAPMDISRMGRYVIDGNTLGSGSQIESKVIADSICTWGTGLFAYQDRLPSGMTPAKLDNMYWVSFGLWQELVTKFTHELYQDYEYQGVQPQQKVIDLAAQGIPACLFRLHAPSNEAMEIADFVKLPAGHVILSPQFVPRDESGDSTNGYLVCTVFTPERSEIWIYKGWDLTNGGQNQPLCKLSHPQFKMGFSLHTTWLSKINSREPNYKVPVREDYQDIIKDVVENSSHPPEVKKEIEKLFERVYPLHDRQPKEKDL